jgi:enoyl-CoA hydratase/carnithine racemase
MYDDFHLIRISVADGVCRATIDNPPINLADLSLIGELQHFAEQVAVDDDVRVVNLSPFHELVERYRTMPKVTIAVIEGLARGGGGTQRLSGLVGRARALETILGCADIDALTAGAWGCVYRALPVDQLRPFVDALAGSEMPWAGRWPLTVCKPSWPMAARPATRSWLGSSSSPTVAMMRNHTTVTDHVPGLTHCDDDCAGIRCA